MYRTILVDVPWNESGGGRIKRGADRHYRLLKTRDVVPTIEASPLWRPADSCHLYFWTTNNHLRDALAIVEQLGFRYVTLLSWAKDRFGIGRYFRGQTEHIVFAVRGDYMPTMTNSTSTLINAARRAHSQKPDEAYALIEANSPAPRAELFARARRAGWSAWGDEIGTQLEPTAHDFRSCSSCGRELPSRYFGHSDSVCTSCERHERFCERSTGE